MNLYSPTKLIGVVIIVRKGKNLKVQDLLKAFIHEPSKIFCNLQIQDFHLHLEVPDARFKPITRQSAVAWQFRRQFSQAVDGVAWPRSLRSSVTKQFRR